MALTVALTVALAWPLHRWAEQTVRLGAVARLAALAATGDGNIAKYAAGALRNMQVRLQELPPDQLKALTPRMTNRSLCSLARLLSIRRAPSLLLRGQA